MSWAVLPPHSAGMRIGLFGGSFDPPHEGHLAASELALARVKLDRIWWWVSPGNPLKRRTPAAFEARIAASQRLVTDPRIIVTGVEASLGSTRTADTLAKVLHRAPDVRFVWLMGADNLAGFHRWHAWRDIAGLVPIAVIDRPGQTFRATASPAARMLARFRIKEADASLLADCPPPAWVFLHGLRHHASSTALRGTGTKAES